MLTDHVFIITGASSGIGAATAIEAARNGMDMVITARRADRLEEVAAEVSRLGRRCEIVAGDVAEPGMSQRLIDAAERGFGRFDAIFANAGYGLHRSMLALHEGEMRDMFEVNFFAGVDLLQRGARRLLEAERRGHLLMCSSCLAKFTLPGSGMYCATKAAQSHFCRALDFELRGRGVRVSCVHPVGTSTEFMEASARRSGTSAGSPPRMFMQPPERVARAVIRCLRRPKTEVWTSWPTRLLMGLGVMFPRFADAAMRAAARTQPEAGATSPHSR